MHGLKFPKALYHVIFWLSIYAFWIVLFRSYSIVITRTMTIQFCYLIFVTADFYIINNLIVPRFLTRNKYFLFLTLLSLTIAISSWLRALIAQQMNLQFFPDAGVRDFLSLYIESFINISVWVLVVSLGNMILERKQTSRRVDMLEKERIKNELDYLKAQINPHTLFNSLNTVYGYIEKTNQTGRDILIQFSELLRYQLYECNEETVSLGKEMEYLKRYISFERLRKDASLQVGLNLDNFDPALHIAPLMLVVLVENAFKFVSHFSDKVNKICVEISTMENTLRARIWNTTEYQEDPDHQKKAGVGIANLRRRLELMYKNKYEFKIAAGKDFYEVNLTIELK